MTTDHSLAELAKEARMGAPGTESADRDIPCIDLSDFEARRAEITEQLWSAATDIGFFQVVGHGIDAAEIDRVFANAAAFFDLPAEAKAALTLDRADNVGWEHTSQVRPSTGTPDQKESYQITRPHMAGRWPDEADLPGFEASMLEFEARCRAVAMRILSCFADRLGFDREFFARAHDPASPQYQSTLRLIHYFARPPGEPAPEGMWRAGAHTDFDCLTLLFQRDGQGGLQVCPGRDVETQEWTPVPPSSEAITCNIGDMLMRWSDDRLLSNFHRVRLPEPGEYDGPRYSIPFFAQADRDVVIEPPGGTYPPISARDYLLQRIRANYSGT